MTVTYIHQLKDWPRFRWDERVLMRLLPALRHRQGRLLGQMEALGFSLPAEAILRSLTEEPLKSSEIEGEFLDPAQVRSSVARHLGIEIAGLVPSERKVDGMVEMTLDATRNFAAPLTVERLLGWHRGLFPREPGSLKRIRVGAFRDSSSGPMQVVSGPIGRETVHFEAPAGAQVAGEMDRFLEFFEGDTSVDPVLKAGIAHLHFLTIHPFDDGNGRLGRAIADLALARSEQASQRFYSLSAQIRAERDAYYRVLERTQQGDLDITQWLVFFLGALDGAISQAESALEAVVRKARFWEKYAVPSLNERQRKMLERLFGDFIGKLTSSKWAQLAKCSQDTALRDIEDLVQRGILVKDRGGGRSTSYSPTAG
jgi:Fic family protein